MERNGFVHLHVHSEYSLLDGAIRVKDLPRLAKNAGHTAVALTDHGNLFGAVAFACACREEGIKPILGCEVYVAPRSRFIKTQERTGNAFHLVLLVENERGYHNLIDMLSRSYIEGFYGKPRVDDELLAACSEGLIALSGCLGGYIPQCLVRGEYETARDYAQKLAGIFGKDHFYLELQDHGLSEQRAVNAMLLRLSEETGIPVVATNDAHYPTRADADTQAVLLCIQMNRIITDGRPIGFETDEFYYKSTDEMAELFARVPQALANTVDIAARCNFDFTFDRLFLPAFKTPGDIPAGDYLTTLAEEGFRQRLADGTLCPTAEHPQEEYRARIDYELSVINGMGYAEYYLIVWDFVHYARTTGIPTGPGRGSGAGSLVAFLIGITEIDSIRYQLMFERFLNPERISMPDFDVDFCNERRGEVIEYVTRKYGADHVAQIITFGTLAPRAAVRDVGRALGMSYAETDAVARLIPQEHSITLHDALEGELKTRYDEQPQVHRLLDYAMKLEGMPRHASTHAAGVVITDRPVSEYVPLAVSGEQPVTQFDMDTVAKLGLLKIDFLGLRYLTVIADAEKMMMARDASFRPENIPQDDRATFAMLSQGQTDGVFQLESGGMRQMLQNMKPACMEDIVAAIALYRPGPMESIPRYLANRADPDSIRYPIPALKPILDLTYGCIVYQEQVMQIFRAVAGYTFGRADIVRRAMSKKKTDVMEEERTAFLDGLYREDGSCICEGAVRRGADRVAAERLFDEMAGFARYAFNKSHAAAYAQLSYRTAYLKCHAPAEYFAALLTSVEGNTAKTAEYIAEAARSGIRLEAPFINESRERFTVAYHDGRPSIRFGLSAVRGVGVSFVEKLLLERDTDGAYQSFEDFVARMASKELNRRQVEALIQCGAFDGMGVTRAALYASYETLIDRYTEQAHRRPEGQIDLFAAYSENPEAAEAAKPPAFAYPALPEFSLRERLTMEKEATGQYFSGHLLDDYSAHLASLSPASINDIQLSVGPDGTGEGLYRDRQTVTVAGVVIKRVNKQTKAGASMAFVTLEGRYGTMELVVFPKVLDGCGALLQPDACIYAVGEISMREDEEPKLLLRQAKPLINNKDFHAPPQRPAAAPAGTEARAGGTLYLNLPCLDETDPLFRRTRAILKIFEGPDPVVLHDRSSGRYVRTKNGGVAASPFVCAELSALLGEENVVLRES